MQSVIAKAKQHKYERQEQKRVCSQLLFMSMIDHVPQVTDTLTQELDSEFKSIHSLLVQESDRFEQEVGGRGTVLP